MNDPREISFESLRRRVLGAVRSVGTESIRIDQSHGRVLAETIRATGPQPAFDKSAMDGYALRHTDAESAAARRPVRLRVVGTIAAGQRRPGLIRRECAVKIMTGAPLPPGSDCVVKAEDTSEDQGWILLSSPCPRHQHVWRRGSDIRRGRMVLRGGTVIGPAEMAMLALLDHPRVTVYRSPRVGIVSTGDELRPVGRRRQPWHIPDSNRYGLLGLVESAGCVPVNGGRCGDNARQLHHILTRLAHRCEFIISSGGVSAGDRDVVKVLFRRLGGVGLYRLPMKPGRPQAFGRVDGTPFFGLPGNPVSSMVVFDFLIRPALHKLSGRRRAEVTGWPATAAVAFPAKSQPWEFPRVTASERGGRLVVRPTASQRSSDLRSMTDADGYVVLPPGTPAPAAGEIVRFVPFVV